MPNKDEFTMLVDVPTEAHLVLLTDRGDRFPVTKETMRRLHLVDQQTVMSRFANQLCRALGIEDLDEADPAVNTIRYMIECAVFYDHDYDYDAQRGEPEASVRNATTNQLLRALLLRTASV
jgi:hypothetical protein